MDQLIESSRNLSVDWEKLLGIKRQSMLLKHAREQDWAIDNVRKNYQFITGSSYKGEWNILGLAGKGTYIMPHGKLLNFKNFAKTFLKQI